VLAGFLAAVRVRDSGSQFGGFGVRVVTGGVLHFPGCRGRALRWRQTDGGDKLWAGDIWWRGVDDGNTVLLGGAGGGASNRSRGGRWRGDEDSIC
jgi:hypothetical protein